jgi:methylphosphotriester-DNA--protein-cysteine methyltransferase
MNYLYLKGKNMQSKENIEAQKAGRILEQEISDIRHVKDWAAKTGCSKKKLQRIIKAHFGITAKKKLKRIRFKVIKQTVQEHPDITSYALAKRAGLENEQTVYHFLNRNFETNFSNLKVEILMKQKKGGGSGV